MRHGFLILGAVAPAGCATHDPREGFAPVQQEVAALSGDRVEWGQGSDAERLADDRVWSFPGPAAGA